MPFTPAQLATLANGFAEVHGQFEELRDRYCLRPYATAAAREHAIHGFGRRLGTLIRCVDRVFDLLPPESDEMPSAATREDATVCIQAFIANIVGAMDNLAWTWVSEKGVTQPDGQSLPRTWVGLGPSYRQVFASFTPAFQSYLRNRQDWLSHIKDFRDALAHRIPLYIPPYRVAPEHWDEYVQLGADAAAALDASEMAAYDAFKAQQHALGSFSPCITHSFEEHAPVIWLHTQLLNDFATLHEMGQSLADELDA
jgi:hypothetical protein